MADVPQNDPLAERTRANLAYIFAVSVLLMLGYILYRWGDQKEILTLVIGIIGGTILGGIFGVYFGATLSGKKPDAAINGDNNVITTPPVSGHTADVPPPTN